MHLSDLQTKEIINITTGARVGVIVDVIIDNEGKIKSLVLEQRRGNKRFLGNRDELELSWREIIKIGDDIILIDTRNR